jgi:hypothetical protein
MAKRGAEIVVLALQPPEPDGLISPGQLRHSGFCEGEKVGGMRATQFVLLAACGELLASVLHDRRQNRKSLADSPHEADVDESAEVVERCTAHSLGRLQREATREDPEPREEPPLAVAEQPVAPVERVPKRPLVHRHVARPSRKQLEAPFEAGKHRLWRQEFRPRRGQLDGERQPVDGGADLGDGREGALVQLETGVGGPGPFEEERRRGFPGQRCQHVLVLARDAQAGPARYEQAYPRAGASDLDEERRRVDHVLEVVEYEQEARAVEVAGEVLLALPQPERPGDRRLDESRVGNRRERDGDDPVGEGVGARVRDGESQARLADSTRTGDREQTNVGTAQDLLDDRGLGVAADEPRRTRRERRAGRFRRSAAHPGRARAAGRPSRVRSVGH